MIGTLLSIATFVLLYVLILIFENGSYNIDSFRLAVALLIPFAVSTIIGFGSGVLGSAALAGWLSVLAIIVLTVPTLWLIAGLPIIVVAASRAKMLKMATKIADGIMMSDVTLPLMEESIGAINEGLALHNRPPDSFHINNLYAWHIKKEKEAARDEAKRKIWVRGLLQRWYLEPFLDQKDCDLVQSKMDGFAKSYFMNSPVVDGIPDSLMDALVDNITLTGDLDDIDKQIEILKEFEAGGFTEFGFRLYEDPAESIKLIGERIVPEFH